MRTVWAAGFRTGFEELGSQPRNYFRVPYGTNRHKCPKLRGWLNATINSLCSTAVAVAWSFRVLRPPSEAVSHDRAQWRWIPDSRFTRVACAGGCSSRRRLPRYVTRALARSLHHLVPVPSWFLVRDHRPADAAKVACLPRQVRNDGIRQIDPVP